jgi:hypothetical protein
LNNKDWRQELFKQYEADGGREKRQFSKERKLEAKEHEILYHCTTANALLSIAGTRKFYLSSLDTVNDDDESRRINAPWLRNKVFVGCFTCDPMIPDTHWDEYGSQKNGVSFSLRQDWFTKTLYYSEPIVSRNEANKQMDKDIVKRATSKGYYSLNGFSFVKVLYDDKLVHEIADEYELVKENECRGKIRCISPDVAGTVKMTSGMCSRNGEKPYQKCWSEEKEVRLKVVVMPINHEDALPFKRIEVQLSDQAFKEMSLKFSPQFNPEEKEPFIADLRRRCPGIKISII